MESSKPAFEKYIFVCENERESGACCGAPGTRIREELRRLVKEKGLSKRVRVSRAGCLDVCADGPNVLLMPDNVWFKKVTSRDVEKIIETSLRGVMQ